MDIGRLMACLLAFALVHFPLHADADTPPPGLASFCGQQLPGSDTCHVQVCPCPAPARTLAEESDPQGGDPWCACGSQLDSLQVNRQRAVAACADYRLNNRQPCFISRDECPPGFEALQRYADGADIQFIACRDRRNEPPDASANRVAVMRSQPNIPVMEQYRDLVSALEKGRQGSVHELPPSTISALAPYFHGLPLQDLTFTQTRALSNGCYSDCEHIYCASGKEITDWTRPQAPLLSRDLLHMIIHAESCEREGGRERYVSHWLRYLSDGVQQRLLQGQAVDASQIHFAMYMERHAEIRARNLCLTIPGCRME
ncbi:MAG: hypothetical protein P8178_15130 [Candidatus Thiodiazotropha sp.]